MLVHNDMVNLPLTEEYIKDCTNNFAPDQEVGTGTFGTVYTAKDTEDDKMQFIVKRPLIVFSSASAITQMEELLNRDIAVRHSFLVPYSFDTLFDTHSLPGISTHTYI
jgi:hypothetical protein